MSGDGEVRFHDAERTVLRIGPGDVVYLPARLPSRIVPRTQLVQIRIKDVPPFTEAVAWFCESCGALVHRAEFTAEVPQRHYWDASAAFNADSVFRTCRACGAVSEPVDMSDFAWADVAEALEGTGGTPR